MNKNKTNIDIEKKARRNKVIVIAVFVALIFGFAFLYKVIDDLENNLAWLEQVVLSVITALFVAIAMMVIDILLRLNSDKEQHEKTLSTYGKALNTWLTRECLFCKSSISAVHPNRDSVNLQQLFKEANNRIYILTTNLSSLINYKNTLRAKADKKVDVKICTLHPSNAIIFNIFRSTGTSSPPIRFNTMKSSLLEFLETFKGLNSVKTYEEIPSMILFIADNNCVVSLLFKGCHARNTLHITYDLSKSSSDDDGVSCNLFLDHFNKIYADAKTITEEDTTQLEFNLSDAKKLIDRKDN